MYYLGTGLESRPQVISVGVVNEVDQEASRFCQLSEKAASPSINVINAQDMISN